MCDSMMVTVQASAIHPMGQISGRRRISPDFHQLSACICIRVSWGFGLGAGVYRIVLFIDDEEGTFSGSVFVGLGFEQG